MMGQISATLRNVVGGHAHWCPGCDEMHVIPSGWTFSGDAVRPSFMPSVKISGVRRRTNADGSWEWIFDAAGKPIPFVCHYFLKDGRLQFCSDSTHKLTGQTVLLPFLPAHAWDPEGY